MAIWRPTNDTPLTPLRTPFGLLADSVEADLDARGFARYATKALMDANTTAADGTHATVYADGTPANNGDYATKNGVWTLLTLQTVVGTIGAYDANVAISASSLTKYNNLVTVAFTATRSAGFNTNSGVAVLPAGFRPNGDRYFSGGQFGSGAPITFKLDGAGIITCLLATSGSSVVAATTVFKAA